MFSFLNFKKFIFIFFIFILVAILKILKTKSTTLSDDLFLCQVSEGSAVRVNLTFFAPWLPWQLPPFWIFSTPPKSCHRLRWIFLQRNPNLFKYPLFCFHGNCGKVDQPIPIFFLAYLVPLDVNVVPIKFHQFLFGE